MRQFVVLVVLLLVSVFAEAARAAEPTLIGATASPSTAAPGQPVRFTATLAEPAPAGGVELTLRIFGDWTPTPTVRVLVPAGERTVSYDWVPPVGFRPFRDYQLQAYTGGVTVRAYFRANGLTDAGGYAVTAYDAPPTMVAGRSYPAVATINRPAPAGGLLLDWQQYGAYGPFITAPRSVWVPAGSRKAGLTLYAPTQDLIGAGRLRTGIGLGFWSQPGGGPNFQKVDIDALRRAEVVLDPLLTQRFRSAAVPRSASDSARTPILTAPTCRSRAITPRSLCPLRCLSRPDTSA